MMGDVGTTTIERRGRCVMMGHVGTKPWGGCVMMGDVGTTTMDSSGRSVMMGDVRTTTIASSGRCVMMGETEFPLLLPAVMMGDLGYDIGHL